METTVSVWWTFWWVFPLLMLIIMLACAAMLVMPFRSRFGANSALEILDERLARGEISADEYAQKRGAMLSSDA